MHWDALWIHPFSLRIYSLRKPDRRCALPPKTLSLTLYRIQNEYPRGSRIIQDFGDEISRIAIAIVNYCKIINMIWPVIPLDSIRNSSLVFRILITLKSDYFLRKHCKWLYFCLNKSFICFFPFRWQWIRQVMECKNLIKTWTFLSEIFRRSGQSVHQCMTPVEEYLHHDVQLVSIPYRFWWHDNN